MSRRAPNPAAERAAQNQATIKSLLKLEPNKVCADCKKNKHPRWASWNLGVFICIRCSGIHRGMGTHISRVKSVDLDSWTDEQMRSVLSWGNARANKYWESKLSPGHVPSDAKMENFIRTKYELKRWAMDGPLPDPATLDAGAADDDIPLSVVREKQTIERRESARRAGGAAAAPAPRAAPAPVADLIGGDDGFGSSAPVARASSAAASAAARAPPPAAKPAAAPPSNSSLLGLDFLGDSSAPQRPASTTGVSTPGAQSRPDLKQSILSLYASAPKPQPPPQQPQHGQQGSFGGMTSPTAGGGFNDAFSSLSIGGSSTTSPRPAAADPFASFGRSTPGSTASNTNTSSFGGLGGGSFFDPPKPAAAPAPVSSPPLHQKQPSDGGFGDFGSFASAPAPAPARSQPAPAASADLFDLSAPTTTTSPPPPASTASPPVHSTPSVFDLSASQKPAPAPAKPAVPAFGGSALSGADVWGSNEWATPDPAPAPAAAPPAAVSPAPLAAPSITPATATAGTNDFGWGTPPSTTGAASSGLGGGGLGSFASTPIVPGAGGGFSAAPPKVAADEEFGGWSSGTTTAATTATAKPPATGLGGAEDDLFSNVWQ